MDKTPFYFYMPIFLIPILICFQIYGPNTVINDLIAEEKIFTIDDYDIYFTADKDWEEVSQDNFDIKITNDKCYFNVMAYHTVDLAEIWTPAYLYDWHNNDIFSQRENVEIIKSCNTYLKNGKTILYTLYSAEHENDKYYYGSCMVTFSSTDF